jgi:hypothetical protein
MKLLFIALFAMTFRTLDLLSILIFFWKDITASLLKVPYRQTHCLSSPAIKIPPSPSCLLSKAGTSPGNSKSTHR